MQTAHKTILCTRLSNFESPVWITFLYNYAFQVIYNNMFNILIDMIYFIIKCKWKQPLRQFFVRDWVILARQKNKNFLLLLLPEGCWIAQIMDMVPSLLIHSKTHILTTGHLGTCGLCYKNITIIRNEDRKWCSKLWCHLRA